MTKQMVIIFSQLESEFWSFEHKNELWAKIVVWIWKFLWIYHLFYPDASATDLGFRFYNENTLIFQSFF